MKLSLPIAALLISGVLGCNPASPVSAESSEDNDRPALRAGFAGLPQGPTVGAVGATFKFSKGWNGFEAKNGKVTVVESLKGDPQLPELVQIADYHLQNSNCKFIAFGPYVGKGPRQHLTLAVATSKVDSKAPEGQWDSVSESITHKGKVFNFTMFGAPGKKSTLQHMLESVVKSVEFSAS